MAHQRVHSGDKPYSCAGCGTKFRLNGNLKTHAWLHVGGEEFQCHLCEKVYPHADNLRQHILSFHEVMDEEVMILLQVAHAPGSKWPMLQAPSGPCSMLHAPSGPGSKLQVAQAPSSKWPMLQAPSGPCSRPKLTVAQAHRGPSSPNSQWPKFQVAQIPSGSNSQWIKFPVAQVAQAHSSPSSQWPKFPMAQVPCGPNVAAPVRAAGGKSFKGGQVLRRKSTRM